MIRRPATVDPNSRFACTSANSKRQAPGKRNGRKNGWKLQASLRSCQNVESLSFESSIRTVNRCPFPEITSILLEVSWLFFQAGRGGLLVKRPSLGVLLDRYHASPWGNRTRRGRSRLPFRARGHGSATRRSNSFAARGERPGCTEISLARSAVAT